MSTTGPLGQHDTGEGSDFLFVYLDRSFSGVCRGARYYLGVGYVLACPEEGSESN